MEAEAALLSASLPELNMSATGGSWPISRPSTARSGLVGSPELEPEPELMQPEPGPGPQLEAQTVDWGALEAAAQQPQQQQQPRWQGQGQGRGGRPGATGRAGDRPRSSASCSSSRPSRPSSRGSNAPRPGSAAGSLPEPEYAWTDTERRLIGANRPGTALRMAQLRTQREALASDEKSVPLSSVGGTSLSGWGHGNAIRAASKVKNT